MVTTARRRIPEIAGKQSFRLESVATNVLFLPNLTEGSSGRQRSRVSFKLEFSREETDSRRFAGRELHLLDLLSVSKGTGDYDRNRMYSVRPVRQQDSGDCSSLCRQGCLGFGHPPHTHIDEPFADVCGVEPDARAHSEGGNSPTLGSTENRQSRDFQQASEFVCCHRVVK